VKTYEYEQHFIDTSDGETICLHRFCENPDGPAVFLVHGSIENAKIFYTKSGKGLAPYLASLGMDVYAQDMRGRGESTPKVSRQTMHTQTQQIMEDIPTCINKIKSLNNSNVLHVGAHSWGGVLVLSHLARFPETKIDSIAFFGTKRKIYVKSFRKFVMVDLGWNLFGRLATKLWGYLPAKKFRYGSENEPGLYFKEVNHWVYTDEWEDMNDGFDYSAQLKSMKLPPILSMTGTADKILGNPGDVEKLIEECGSPEDSEIVIVGRHTGFMHDYDHINLLTHKDCPEDHFKLVSDWYSKHTIN